MKYKILEEMAMTVSPMENQQHVTPTITTIEANTENLLAKPQIYHVVNRLEK
jgi:hypothetical protein